MTRTVLLLTTKRSRSVQYDKKKKNREQEMINLSYCIIACCNAVLFILQCISIFFYIWSIWWT